MNTQKWTPEMIQAWQNTRSLVRSVLATGGQDQATDDVWQSVWLAANQSIPSFDPKFGRFTHWINGVAWNTAKRHLKSNAQDMNIRSAAADESRSGANSPFDVVAADFTEAFAENADHWEEVASILRCTRAVMNPVFFDRVMTLYLRHDGCVRDAARQMQVSEPMLRECQREFIDTARTVHRATQLHWHHYTTGADPTRVRHILQCLPQDDQGGRSWMPTVMTLLCIRGGFQHVSANELAEMTGWSHSASRYRLRTARRLCETAYQVIEHGHVLAA